MHDFKKTLTDRERTDLAAVHRREWVCRRRTLGDGEWNLKWRSGRLERSCFDPTTPKPISEVTQVDPTEARMPAGSGHVVRLGGVVAVRVVDREATNHLDADPNHSPPA
jgi:hypothetical protein